MTAIAAPTLDSEFTVELRPRYEGANIGPWIGFKHVNYLIEEALIEAFRQADRDVRGLYVDHALCWEIVDIDTRIVHVFNLDETVRVEVAPARKQTSGQLAFNVAVFGPRDGRELKLASSRVKVTTRTDSRWNSPHLPIPEDLVSATVKRIERKAPEAGFGAAPEEGLPTDVASLTEGRNAFLWKWRIPYFYCHFTERLQMSGYLRIMEEVVGLFQEDRGASIGDLLTDAHLIPVVPRSRISMTDEVYMEEELYTVFVVEDVFKELTYTARMECYVVRDGKLVNTAIGAITHGYAQLKDRAAWDLSNLSERLRAGIHSS